MLWVGPVDAHYEEIIAATNLVFEVDPFGNATANSLTITGGSITIEDPDGGSSFEVTKAGVLTAKEAEIEGKITATVPLFRVFLLLTSGRTYMLRPAEDWKGQRSSLRHQVQRLHG